MHATHVETALEMSSGRKQALEMEGFDESLSEYVRKNPALYDKRDSSFKDKIKKNNAWAKVAQVLDIESGGKSYIVFFSKSKLKEALKRVFVLSGPTRARISVKRP